MSIAQLALIFFIITNPVGNIPAVVALVRHYPLKTQQKIMLRESLFSMILAIFFLFVGDAFLFHLNIQNYALNFSGGILLLIVAIKMIFSIKDEETVVATPKQEPFIVPIATPLLSGAGLLTMIMLYGKEESSLTILAAILVAWIGVTLVLFLAPYLQIFLGKRGMSALEQLMGMLLAMMGVGMIVKGTSLFLTALSTV